jgi:hypothetical protein
VLSQLRVHRILQFESLTGQDLGGQKDAETLGNFFRTGVQAQRSLAFGMGVGSGMKWWQTGFCSYPGVILALPLARVLWKTKAGGLVV